MTYAPRPTDFVPCFETAFPPVHRAPVPRRSLVRRLLGVVFPSPAQQAEQEAARYLERAGGRLTDEIERQITDRLITGGWRR